MIFNVKSINTVYIAGKEVDGMKRPREKGNRDTRIEQSDITEKEDITAEEQEMLNEQMRNQMMLLYEMEKDEIEVQEEQNRIIERMEESE